jgi:8-oxo-dGTP pyrophosphatase MutT (NUDIX family)
LLDVLDASGHATGVRRPRGEVHELGLWHRAVHTWLFAPSADGSQPELLLQLRASCKDSWPGRWDISSAGHVGAGEASAPTAVRELAEELGLSLPAERFEYYDEYVERMSSEQRGGRFTNNERCDVFVVTLSARERAALDPASPHRGFALQAEEVSAVRWAPLAEVRALYESGDASIVPLDGWPAYARLFDELEARVAALAAAAAEQRADADARVAAAAERAAERAAAAAERAAAAAEASPRRY